MIGTKIKFGIILSLVAGLAFLGWMYRYELQESARLAEQVIRQRADLEDQARRIENLEQKRKAAEAVAARERSRVIRIRVEARELRDAISKLETESRDVAAWADTPMPGDLVDLLRNAGADSEN